MAWVALVGPEIEENLSLRYLASSLAQAGYRSEILPFADESEFGSVIEAVFREDEPPIVVGISLAFQWRAMDMLAVAMQLRERGYTGHILLGGHFATFAAKEILRDFAEVDSVIRQEGEETLVAVVQAIASGGALDAIPGLAFRNGDDIALTGMPTVPDLAKLPMPDRRGEPAACFDHRIAPLVSSRGCYAHCTFCCIAAWHEETQPGKRYRLREPEAVADEMVALKRTRGIEIFVFHDDNFFVPGANKNGERFEALAKALEDRQIGPYATVVKARPTDVNREVFAILKDRLNCIRCYIGVETDSEQGLETLRRWSKPRQNHAAIEVARELGLYVCFNMLVFDPDTTVETLMTNVEFMEFASDYPSNFGRVELYAGTPLLHRMQQEGRVRGDYMQWDYNLHDPVIERVYQITLGAFRERNFGPAALNNRIMGTRFDVEVVKHFHPDVYEDRWHAEGVAITEALGRSSAAGLREVLAHVASTRPGPHDRRLVDDLALRLRADEDRLRGRAEDLAAALLYAVGQGRPLTSLGDKVATPLLRGVSAYGLS